MARYRSIVTFFVVILAVFLVNFSSLAATKAPSYTPAQIQQIQRSTPGIQALRDRLPELATLIENRKWNDVESFIHGPYGELRLNMLSLARNLKNDAKTQATETAKNVFGHLVKIDEAAQQGSYQQAIRNYAEAVKDFDAFLQLIPQA